MASRATSRATKKTDSGLAARVAATASLGAALIHFAVVPAHWREWALSGVFFALLALFQLAWSGFVLVSPTAVTLFFGIAANLGSVALWAWSRTAGVPFGPHAGEPELVRAAGLCALLLQIYIVMGAAWMLHRGRRPEPVSGIHYGMVLTGAGTVIAAAAAVGVASGLQHGHHAPVGTAEHDHHAPAGTESGHHHDEPAWVAPSPDSDSIGPPTAPMPIPASPLPEPIHADGHQHDHG